MQIHQVKSKTKRQKKKLIGRGGKRGTYSGRGVKGQKAHAGRKIRPELRDIIKKLPKRRGYGKNRALTVYSDRAKHIELPIGRLEKLFSPGESVTPKTLVQKGVLHIVSGKVPKVKLIGATGLTKKLLVSECFVSAGAKTAIESAGGTVSVR